MDNKKGGTYQQATKITFPYQDPFIYEPPSCPTQKEMNQPAELRSENQFCWLRTCHICSGCFSEANMQYLSRVNSPKIPKSQPKYLSC